jgi:hypothetical protein
VKSFYDIFQQQKRYNAKIRARDGRSIEEWTETYLIGLVSEIDDVLDSIRWKRHRKADTFFGRPKNLGNDFADLTKYIFSLWELWGFESDTVLKYVEEKNNILDELYRQEFELIPTDKLIVITDLDGTLGDWRKSFIKWSSDVYGIEINEDSSTSLQLDSDLAMHYPDYFRMKEEFESNGNYRYISLYPEVVEFLNWLREEFDAYIIAHTARPWQRYYRIWGDTWDWIVEKKLQIDQLRIGSDSRILLANKLGGANVLMLEDDPGLMLRAAYSDINVVARSHPYNNGVEHARIYKVENFLDAKERIRNDFQTYRRKDSVGQTS